MLWTLKGHCLGGRAHWALGFKEVALQVPEQNHIILYKISLILELCVMGKVGICLERRFMDFLMFLFIDFFKMLPFLQFLS